MAASIQTKKCRRIVIILTILSALFMIAPAVVYIAIGFATAGEAAGLVLSGLAALTVFVCLLCISLKHIPRTLPWIVMLGLFTLVNNHLLMVVIFAATQIIDEIVISPLLSHYKTAFISNKTIDKRGGFISE